MLVTRKVILCSPSLTRSLSVTRARARSIVTVCGRFVHVKATSSWQSYRVLSTRRNKFYFNISQARGRRDRDCMAPVQCRSRAIPGSTFTRARARVGSVSQYPPPMYQGNSCWGCGKVRSPILQQYETNKGYTIRINVF